RFLSYPQLGELSTDWWTGRLSAIFRVRLETGSPPQGGWGLRWGMHAEVRALMLGELVREHVREGERAGGLVVLPEQVQPLHGHENALGDDVPERRVGQAQPIPLVRQVADFDAHRRAARQPQNLPRLRVRSAILEPRAGHQFTLDVARQQLADRGRRAVAGPEVERRHSLGLR